MRTLHSGYARRDSAHTALIVGGIAAAVASAALFGIVAHTWTPFLPQKGASPGYFEAAARREAAPAVQSTELIPRKKWPQWIPFAPRADEFVAAGTVAPAKPVVEALPPPITVAAVPADSLSPSESVVLLEGEASAPQAFQTRIAEAEPAGPPAVLAKLPDPMRAETRLAETRFTELASLQVKVPEPRVEMKVAEAKPVEIKQPFIKAAELKVVTARPTTPPPVPARLIELPRVEPKAIAKAKPVEAKRVEPKAMPTKVVEVKRPEPKRAEPKAVPTKVAEAKRPEPKAVPTKLAEPKVVVKPITLKVSFTKPVESRRLDPKRVETKAAEAKAVEAKAHEAKRVEAKRLADVKVAEAKAAEAKRVAQAKASETKLAESKHAAEMKAAEAKLADARRAAELMAVEAKLAETQRAVEMKAAEAKLAETKRAVDATLAEAKVAEAKLAATKRAVEVTLAEAKPGVKPAVETRVFETRQGDSAKPRLPRYASCESCGTVNSITRFLDRGKNNWEVRVGFGGADRVFVFPTDPGLAIGERVRYESGRLIGEYPRRTAAL